MSSPPACSPSDPVPEPAHASVAPSLFAVCVGYNGCAPKNVMVSLHPGYSGTSSLEEEHGVCLEARAHGDDNKVTLIVSARDVDIAHCCTKIAETLHGSIVSCTRITTDEERQAALRPSSDSGSDSDFESSSHSGPDQRTLAVFRESPLSEFGVFLGIILACFAAFSALAAAR